ncbi:MAG: hypothetical protein IT223_12465 [Crocinitomicaceae bacterium]|nr:hypothetical protein [Crocinitomicaceae bacterium]
MLKTCGSGIIFLDYFIHKEYITETFCVNKIKPEMKCDGKCHLKKELEKEEKKNTGPLASSKEKKEEQLCQEVKCAVILFPVVFRNSYGNFYLLSDSDLHRQIIDHPPIV